MRSVLMRARNPSAATETGRSFTAPSTPLTCLSRAGRAGAHCGGVRGDRARGARGRCGRAGGGAGGDRGARGRSRAAAAGALAHPVSGSNREGHLRAAQDMLQWLMRQHLSARGRCRWRFACCLHPGAHQMAGMMPCRPGWKPSRSSVTTGVRCAQERGAVLRAEPPAGEAAATCVVRLPDGRRCARRFRPGDPLDQLFAWVDAQGGGGAGFGPYHLACPSGAMRCCLVAVAPCGRGACLGPATMAHNPRWHGA